MLKRILTVILLVSFAAACLSGVSFAEDAEGAVYVECEASALPFSQKGTTETDFILLKPVKGAISAVVAAAEKDGQIIYFTAPEGSINASLELTSDEYNTLFESDASAVLSVYGDGENNCEILLPKIPEKLPDGSSVIYTYDTFEDTARINNTTAKFERCGIETCPGFRLISFTVSVRNADGSERSLNSLPMFVSFMTGTYSENTQVYAMDLRGDVYNSRFYYENAYSLFVSSGSFTLLIGGENVKTTEIEDGVKHWAANSIAGASDIGLLFNFKYGKDIMSSPDGKASFYEMARILLNYNFSQIPLEGENTSSDTMYSGFYGEVRNDEYLYNMAKTFAETFIYKDSDYEYYKSQGIRFSLKENLSRLTLAAFFESNITAMLGEDAATLDEARQILSAFSDTSELSDGEALIYGTCVKYGLFIGTGAGTLRPFDTLTKAELVTVIVRWFSFVG